MTAPWYREKKLMRQHLIDSYVKSCCHGITNMIPFYTISSINSSHLEQTALNRIETQVRRSSLGLFLFVEFTANFTLQRNIREREYNTVPIKTTSAAADIHPILLPFHCLVFRYVLSLFNCSIMSVYVFYKVFFLAWEDLTYADHVGPAMLGYFINDTVTSTRHTYKLHNYVLTDANPMGTSLLNLLQTTTYSHTAGYGTTLALL